MAVTSAKTDKAGGMSASLAVLEEEEIL